MLEELKKNIDCLNNCLRELHMGVRYEFSYDSCYYVLKKIVAGDLLVVLRSTYTEVNHHVFLLKDVFETMMYSKQMEGGVF